VVADGRKTVAGMCRGHAVRADLESGDAPGGVGHEQIDALHVGDGLQERDGLRHVATAVQGRPHRQVRHDFGLRGAPGDGRGSHGQACRVHPVPAAD
jgi:hypothetical protein